MRTDSTHQTLRLWIPVLLVDRSYRTGVADLVINNTSSLSALAIEGTR